MDANLFDRISRAFAAPGPRRRVLEGLMGMPLAGMLPSLLTVLPGGVGGEDVDAKKKHKKKKKKKKRSSPSCVPDLSISCPGRCGLTPSNCGFPVDCGPCPCFEPRPPCSSCDTTSRSWFPDGALAGQPCGTCRTCDATGQCVAAANNTPCDDGNPCTVNTVCTNGECGGPSGNQGQICGTSTHGGTTLRCCNSFCPDDNCVPSGNTGIACVDNGICSTLNCCAGAGQGTSCDPPCFCPFAQAGGSCGSDHDCSNAGASTACICGTCQVPPP